MGGGRAWGEESDTFSGGRNIGGKWEEVELGGEKPDTFLEGRNIGGKWEESSGRGTQNFGNP